MAYSFTKMHGLGNDFIVIDGMTSPIDLSSDDVSAMCDRHRGIGADGVIIVRPGEEDGFMDYRNADGSLAQMCGNGVRVTAKFLVDHGYLPPGRDSLRIGTRAGLKEVRFETAGGKLSHATVNMGQPILEPTLIPVHAPVDSDHGGVPYVGALTIPTPWCPATVTCVSMGNPHAVWFVDLESMPDELVRGDRLDSLDLSAIGPYLESHTVFPEKANIEFVTVEPDGLHMRVYERGVGETLACGTGACAVLVAAYLTGRTGPSSAVHLPGGTLHIDYREDGVHMTGPASTVFHGTWE